MAALVSTMFNIRREELQPRHELIGAGQGMRRVLDDVGMVAPTDSAVLIQGERERARNSLPAQSMTRARASTSFS